MKGVDAMSLFLPSNLSPNFEEVFVGNSDSENTIVFSFQVNTNGSQIRSYKIEILNELNDEEDPDENILYTEFGTFGYPLYNKDFGYIYLDLTREVEEGNSMTLSDIIVPEKDYRWRVRLYEDEIVDGGSVNINSVYGTTYIGSGNIVGTTKQIIWLDKYNDQIVEEDYVRTILYSGDNTNDYNPFNTKKTGLDEQVCIAYPNFKDGQDYVNEFEIKTNHVLPDYYDKLLDGNTYMSIYNNQTQISNNVQWKYDENNKVLHIYGHGDMANYKLTEQPPWVQYKNQIEQVIIDDGIVSLGNYAFYNYKALKTVVIPRGLKKIGARVFEGCTNLNSFSTTNSYQDKKIIIPGTVQSIGTHAFQGCQNITTLEIQEGVVSIGAAAFQDCVELDIDNVSLPQYSVESIGSNAFAGTTLYNNWNSDVLYVGNYLIKAKEELDGEYSIPEGTVSIASAAFQLCNITNVVMPSTLRVIGQAAFQQCYQLSEITIPEGVVDIKQQAFYKCTGLRTVNFNATDCTAMGSNSYPVFSGCTNLTTINIGESVKAIPSYAFYRCTGLTSVTIPDSVTSIGVGAFYDCRALTSITIPDSVKKIGRDAFDNTDYYNNAIVQLTPLKDGIYLNKAFIKANTSYNGIYYIDSNKISVIADGAFDDVAISRMDPALKRSYGAVWYNNQAICTNNPDREQYTPKLIESLNRTSSTGHSDSVILTLPVKQAYRKDFVENNCFTDENGETCCNLELVYIQRQQVYTIDKSVGNMQLSKLTLDEPLEYNTFHGTTIDVKLKDNNFARNRLYVNSVREFDSKLYSNAYINLAYFEHELINTEQEYFLLTEKPSDWETEYGKYYYSDSNVYNSVKELYEQESFTIEKDSAAGRMWDYAYKTYYVKLSDGQGNEYYSLNTNKEYDPNTEYYVIVPTKDKSDYLNRGFHVNYQKYYIKQTSSNDNYVLNTDSTYYPNQGYYTMTLPEWESNKYYKYRMSNIDISKYKDSSAVQQITNYVSDTGECSLFSDLPFLPDQFYMYQIFVVDTEAPNYDPSKTENPYKFFAGVGYDGKEITGVFDDGLEIFKEGDYVALGSNKPSDWTDNYNKYYVKSNDGKRYILNSSSVWVNDQFYRLTYKHACYLGGGYGITTSTQNRFESSYKSTVYSNHQIANSNQYFCFIQPNLAVKADDYKPCSLEIYNTQHKKTLYITNYNDLTTRSKNYSVEFNKDYSIDTLDDSQWLVTLTYNEDDITDNDGNLNEDVLNNINNLITAPQTKYKIYTNYVDSIPEGYFYCRNNKLMSLEYQDYYTGDVLNAENNTNYKTIYNISRDVLITCDIHDNNNETKNYVSIKSYKYTIGLIDEYSGNFDNSKIIQIKSQDKKYDGRLQIDLRGVNVSDDNHVNLYRIQIEIEDELGYTHFYSEDVCFKDGGNIQILTDCLSTSIDYIAQTANIHINIPNYILEASTVYKILLYKQKMGYKNKQLIASISDDDLYLVESSRIKYCGSVPIIVDYSIYNTNACKYEVYMEAFDNYGETKRYLLISDEYVRPMFKTWSICDLDFVTTNNIMQYGTTDGHYELIPITKVFSVKNNVEIGEISDNLNIITYNTLGQFGRIIQNKQRFDSGSISCMISDMQEHQKLRDCKNITKIDLTGQNINNVSSYINDNIEYYNKNNYLYVVNADQSTYYMYNGYQWVPVNSQYALFTSKRTIDEWRNFVSNGKLKLLKSPDGYMRIVAMSQANNYSVDYKSGQYPAVISFNWQEMMDSDQIIVAKGE